MRFRNPLKGTVHCPAARKAERSGPFGAFILFLIPQSGEVLLVDLIPSPVTIFLFWQFSGSVVIGFVKSKKILLTFVSYLEPERLRPK